MEFYKVVARPTLLYGSETWVITKRDMTGLEAAEMRFLRSVKGYTRLGKIRSEVIRKELEISGIQDVRSIYKQNWINHVERMETPDFRNTPSTTNLEEEGIVDAQGNDGNASMAEQVKRPNPWRKKKKKKKMMMMNLWNYVVVQHAAFYTINALRFTLSATLLITYHYSAVFLTIVPQSLPKPTLQIVRPNAFSFNFLHTFVSLRSPSRCLRLLLHFPSTSIPTCIFPSITNLRRQFPRKI